MAPWVDFMAKTQDQIRKAARAIKAIPDDLDQAFFGAITEGYSPTKASFTSTKNILARHFQYDAIYRYNYPALDPKYARYKLRKHGPKPILVATGALKQSIIDSVKITRKGKGHFQITVDPVVYGKFVKETRNFLALNEGDTKDLFKMFNDTFKKIRKPRNQK